jgi:hypothetical protein
MEQKRVLEAITRWLSRSIKSRRDVIATRSMRGLPAEISNRRRMRVHKFYEARQRLRMLRNALEI